MQRHFALQTTRADELRYTLPSDAHMNQPISELPRDVLIRALREVRGSSVDLGSSNDLSEEAFTKLMEDDETAAALTKAVETQLRRFADDKTEAAWDSTRPFEVEYVEPTVMCGVDYFTDDAPKEAANSAYVPALDDEFFHVACRKEPEYVLFKGQYWAAPYVLGFAEKSFQSPGRLSLLAHLLDEVRNSLAAKNRDKYSLSRCVKWLRSAGQADEWEIESKYPAANFTVVSTVHGKERLILSSLISGEVLYLKVEEPNGKNPEVRVSFSLADEASSVRRLLDVFSGHEEVAQKALSKLRFSLY